MDRQRRTRTCLTTGNSKSQNLNAELDFTKEDALWKHNFFLKALRSKGEAQWRV